DKRNFSPRSNTKKEHSQSSPLFAIQRAGLVEESLHLQTALDLLTAGVLRRSGPRSCAPNPTPLAQAISPLLLHARRLRGVRRSLPGRECAAAATTDLSRPKSST